MAPWRILSMILLAAGAVLGPFFIMYINVILVKIERDCGEVRAISYADDTTLLFKVRKVDPSKDVQKFKEKLEDILELFAGLKLSINTKKTKCLLFRTRQCKIVFPMDCIKVCDEKVELAETAECLGITFSKNIKWQEHINTVTTKCYAAICTIARLRQSGLPREALFTVYRALFEPVLAYGVAVWGSTYQNVIDKFQVIQNDAVRAVLSIQRRKSVRMAYKQFGLLDVRSLATYQVALIMYKHLNGICPLQFMEILPSNPIKYDLRGTRRPLRTKRAISVVCEHSPSVYFTVVWNSLPTEIRSIQSIVKFKHMLKEHLLSKQ